MRAREREGICSVAGRVRVLTAGSSPLQKQTPTLFDIDDFHTEVSSRGGCWRTCAPWQAFFACLYQWPVVL